MHYRLPLQKEIKLGIYKHRLTFFIFIFLVYDDQFLNWPSSDQVKATRGQTKNHEIITIQYLEGI